MQKVLAVLSLRLQKANIGVLGGEKMVQTREFFEEMLANLEEMLQKANKELRESPEGRLVQVTRDGKATFFQVYEIDGHRQRKSINNNIHMVRILIKKRYIQEEIKILEQDIQAVKCFLYKYIEPFFDNIAKRMPQRFITLNSHFKSEGEGKDWDTKPYQQSEYKQEKRIHTTSRGLKVRSKSELLIAEKLYEHHIPFRYEEILWYGNTEFAPDFTIRTRDNRLIYWEHCGMTNNEKYINHHKWKMSIYEKMDIVPWKNLIITYDDESGIISIPIIESEIINKLK